jgi:hypothetical protein
MGLHCRRCSAICFARSLISSARILDIRRMLSILLLMILLAHRDCFAINNGIVDMSHVTNARAFGFSGCLFNLRPNALLKAVVFASVLSTSTFPPTSSTAYTVPTSANRYHANSSLNTQLCSREARSSMRCLIVTWISLRRHGHSDSRTHTQFETRKNVNFSTRWRC